MAWPPARYPASNNVTPVDASDFNDIVAKIVEHLAASNVHGITNTGNIVTFSGGGDAAEIARDAVGAALLAGTHTGLNITVDDAGDKINISVSAAGATGPQGATGPAGATGAAGRQGFTGPSGPQGTTGPTGPGFTGATGVTGPPGEVGATGYAGAESIHMTYNTTTSASGIGMGQIRFNTTTLASAVTSYCYETDAGGNGTAAFLNSMGAGTIMIMRKVSAPLSSWAQYRLTAQTDSGTYRTLTISYISGSGSFVTGDPVWVQFARQGATGPTGATGPMGPTGPPNGPTGATGPTGSTGPMGETGPPGGPTGATGATGPNDSVGKNNQTGTTYTLQLTDAGKVVELDNAAAITVSVPTNATVAFPVDSIIELWQQGTGSVTVDGSAVTLRSPDGMDTLRTQYSSGVLRKRGTDEWVLGGDLI